MDKSKVSLEEHATAISYLSSKEDKLSYLENNVCDSQHTRVLELIYSENNTSEYCPQYPEQPDDAAELCLSSGDRVFQYEIVNHIQSGGMGHVYRATRNDGLTTVDVAIKFIPSKFLVNSGEDSASKFNAEAQHLVDLAKKNNNVCSIYDAGEYKSFKFIVMEYVDGPHFDEYCDEPLIGVNEKLRLFIQVCKTIDECNRNQVVHSDIKPKNILINRKSNQVKLIDFGISLGRDSGEKHKAGTKGFSSPEQLKGGEPTVLDDIYSLGATLYNIITGQIKRNESASTDVAAQASSSDLPWRTNLFFSDLSKIIDKCTASNPSDRYKEAYEIADDLDCFLRLQPLKYAKESILSKAKKLFFRRYVVISLSFIISVITIGSGVQRYATNNELIEQQVVSQSMLQEVKNIYLASDVSGISTSAQVLDSLNVGMKKILDNSLLDAKSKADLLHWLSVGFASRKAYAEAIDVLNKAKQIYYDEIDILDSDNIHLHSTMSQIYVAQGLSHQALLTIKPLIEKLAETGFSSSEQIDLFLNYAQAKELTGYDSSEVNVDIPLVVEEIKFSFWTELTPRQKAGLLKAQVSETFFLDTVNADISPTENMDSERYESYAKPIMQELLLLARQAEQILETPTSKEEAVLLVEIKQWIFRVLNELRLHDEARNSAKKTIEYAMGVYGPNHIQMAKLYLRVFATYSLIDPFESINFVERAVAITASEPKYHVFAPYYYYYESENLRALGDLEESALIDQQLFDLFDSHLNEDLSAATIMGYRESFIRSLITSGFESINESQNNFRIHINQLYNDIWPSENSKLDKNFERIIDAVVQKNFDPLKVRNDVEELLVRFSNEPTLEINNLFDNYPAITVYQALLKICDENYDEYMVHKVASLFLASESNRSTPKKAYRIGIALFDQYLVYLTLSKYSKYRDSVEAFKLKANPLLRKANIDGSLLAKSIKSL